MKTQREVLNIIENKIAELDDKIDKKFQYNLDHMCMESCDTELAQIKVLKEILNEIAK